MQLENSMVVGAQAQIDREASAGAYEEDLEERARAELVAEFTRAAQSAATLGWRAVMVERYHGGEEPIQNRMPLEEGTEDDWLALVSMGLLLDSGAAAAAARSIVASAAELYADEFQQRRMDQLEISDSGH